MNWLDKAIEWVDPEEAYKRQVFRRSIEAERNYDAASYKRPNGNWRVLNQRNRPTGSAVTRCGPGRGIWNGTRM